jgi:hypothetical protein
MFTFNEKDFCVEFKNEQMKYSLCPQTLLQKTNGFTDDKNKFSLDYDDDKVHFLIKYGEGGGTFDFTFEMTEEIRKSLKTALEELTVYLYGTSVTDILCKIHSNV